MTFCRIHQMDHLNYRKWFSCPHSTGLVMWKSKTFGYLLKQLIWPPVAQFKIFCIKYRSVSYHTLRYNLKQHSFCLRFFQFPPVSLPFEKTTFKIEAKGSFSWPCELFNSLCSPKFVLHLKMHTTTPTVRVTAARDLPRSHVTAAPFPCWLTCPAKKSLAHTHTHTRRRACMHAGPLYLSLLLNSITFTSFCSACLSTPFFARRQLKEPRWDFVKCLCERFSSAYRLAPPGPPSSKPPVLSSDSWEGAWTGLVSTPLLGVTF